MAYSADSETQVFSNQAPPERGVDIVRQALDHVRRRLPQGWSLAVQSPIASAGTGVDAVAKLRDPGGVERVLLIQVKRLLNTRDVRNLLWNFEDVRGDRWPKDAQPMLIARYLAPATRERIGEARAAYADATGNMSLVLDEPAIYLRDVGANSDPWRGPGRPRDTLSGAPAARIVRALIDFRETGTVPELAQRAGTSIGATYRVVDLVEQEGLVKRAPRGPLSGVQWRSLLERWSRDYGVTRNNTTINVLAARGLDDLQQRLRALPADFRYAITGSLAAQRLAPYAPARAATIYAEDVDRALRELDLRPVDTGANVVLVAGTLDVVFERLDEEEGLRYAAPSQVAVDLLTGSGRNPSEGEELLNWMKRNESAWRR